MLNTSLVMDKATRWDSHDEIQRSTQNHWMMQGDYKETTTKAIIYLQVM